jgi:hypothetical protein
MNRLLLVEQPAFDSPNRGNQNIDKGSREKDPIRLKAHVTKYKTQDRRQNNRYGFADSRLGRGDRIGIDQKNGGDGTPGTNTEENIPVSQSAAQLGRPKNPYQERVDKQENGGQPSLGRLESGDHNGTD